MLPRLSGTPASGRTRTTPPSLGSTGGSARRTTCRSGRSICWRAVWVRDHPVVQTCLGALIWVAVEQFRGSWPFGGFPWGILAFSKTDAPLVQLAPYGGEVLVSGAVVFVGALMTLVWTRRSQIATAMAHRSNDLCVTGFSSVAPLGHARLSLLSRPLVPHNEHRDSARNDPL
ncbi:MULTISPECIES: hypothetical protein [unclassified Pseudactinotalea]|uniref:hypothetical protein n=1 Tax=unclassified Pseudactinotalea TaxID=2649176 RepID=UPI003C7BA81A